MSLFAEFEARGIVRGGTLMLGSSDAIALVDRAEALEIEVLGIDAFWVTDETTRPDMEHSTDFHLVERSWRSAREFVVERADLGLMFEVVVND